MHEDERGIITDLLVTDEFSVTSVTFTEGAIRGNHLHKETKQIDIIMDGELYGKKIDLVQGEQYGTFKQGDVVVHFPHEAHAYKAITPARLISICVGKRRGEHYEEDTFRLEGNDKLI